MAQEHKLSKTQIVILQLFYRFRFLTRIHIQKLLNHKRNGRISEWTKDLLNQEYLKAKEKDDPTDVREAGVLYLSSKSIQILKKNEKNHKKILGKFYREDDRSDEFVYKCLKVVELFLYYTTKYKDQANVYFYSESDYFGHNYFPNPTCYVSIDFKDRTERTFIEIIPPNTFKNKREYLIKKYLVFLDEGIWQKATHYPYPKVLLICPDKQTATAFEKYLKEDVYNEYDEKEICFEIERSTNFATAKLKIF